MIDCIVKNLKVLNFIRNDLSDLFNINTVLYKETFKHFEIIVKDKENPKLDNFLAFFKNKSIIFFIKYWQMYHSKIISC